MNVSVHGIKFLGLNTTNNREILQHKQQCNFLQSSIIIFVDLSIKGNICALAIHGLREQFVDGDMQVKVYEKLGLLKEIALYRILPSKRPPPQIKMNCCLFYSMQEVFDITPHLFVLLNI